MGTRGDDVAVLAARVPPLPGASATQVVRTLPAQPMSVPLARSWAEGWLVNHVPAVHRDAVLLVVSELMTNAVRQGDGSVRITLEQEKQGLRVEVFDRGHRMPVLAAAAIDSTGGRGLQLIEAVCAEWGVVEQLEGKAVWARLAW